jgi:predicted lipoprotein with Yx(FWY)xxD motif
MPTDPLAPADDTWFALRMRAVVGLVVLGTLAAGCVGEAGRTAGEGEPSDSQRSPSAAGDSPDRSGASSGTGSGEAPSPSGPTAPGRKVKIAPSDYGPMLFDASGQAIYLFEKERTSTPACYGACAEAWPPVLTAGPPKGSGRVRSRLLGTTQRKNGSLQVTYAGHPLYYYADEGKNQVLCHNVTEYGGLWLVVTPSGKPAD